MTALMWAVLTIGTPPAVPVDTPEAAKYSTQSGEKELRTRAQWVADIHDALRRQALADDLHQPEAVVRLLSLYQQLLQDEDLHAPERNRLRLKLRQRIIRIGGELSEDLRARKAKIEVVRRRAEKENRPEKLKKIEHDEAVLAQWDEVLGQAGFDQGAGGGQGNTLDHGEDLVELIQRVIAPDSWDTVGGPMSIVYYRNLRVLVVTATTEVHEQVGGLADALRRAGN